MGEWYVLATVLVATTRIVASFSLSSSPFWCTPSHISPTTSTFHALRHSAITSTASPGYTMRSTTRQGGNLLWRRHRGESTQPPSVSLGLSPVETGVPEVAPHGLSGAALGDGDEGEDLNQKGRRRSSTRELLLLSTVPLVWGTYGPSVKYLYQMGEPTPGLVFNLGCYVVSVLTLGVVAWVNNARSRRRRGASNGLESTTTSSSETALGDRYAARAGLELGGWLFLGGTVQVWGLELTSASRAAFLVQLTTVIVPVLEAVLGQRKLKPQVWFACALATVGVALVSIGGILPPGINVTDYIAGSLSAARFSPWGLWESITNGYLKGDLLVALSAVFYSLHVVRLGVHVSKVETLTLARAKALSELGFSVLSVLVAGFLGGQGESFARFASALASKPELLTVFTVVVLWNGALTTAYAMWAQTRGQAMVPPSEANLVYSLQPLWSTLFAVVLLKEVFRGLESAGAALLLLSLFLVTTQDDTSDESEDAAMEDRVE